MRTDGPVFRAIVAQRVRAHALVQSGALEDVSVLDILDALATAGLRLEVDRIGYAREAYLAEAQSDAE
jgi:hypothetical protein